jgi:hypothetical protein
MLAVFIQSVRCIFVCSFDLLKPIWCRQHTNHNKNAIIFEQKTNKTNKQNKQNAQRFAQQAVRMAGAAFDVYFPASQLSIGNKSGQSLPSKSGQSLPSKLTESRSSRVNPKRGSWCVRGWFARTATASFNSDLVGAGFGLETNRRARQQAVCESLANADTCIC